MEKMLRPKTECPKSTLFENGTDFRAPKPEHIGISEVDCKCLKSKNLIFEPNKNITGLTFTKLY